MAVDCLQDFLDITADAPPERDGRHFRTWQRVSVQVQRAVRTLAAQMLFADGSRVEANWDRAFTIAVYSSCQPCYGYPPMGFTYDTSDIYMLPEALRLIGRSLQARLVQISAGFHGDELLKRRFAPVWHHDILNAVKKKPRMLRESLAREAIMIDALINLGTRPNERSIRRFLRRTRAAARALDVDSQVLQNLVLRTAIQNLGDGRIFEDGDMAAAGSPDAGIGGDENRDYGSPNGCGQVANARIVSDVHACG
jgi:hypothetical protein